LATVRVCREGEAFAVAAGLWLGGKSPVITIQCTGLFEAGDSLRNFIHDLRIPLFVIIGLRNYYTSLAGTSRDTAPRFAQKILEAWDIPFSIFEKDARVEQLIRSYSESQALGEARAIFIGE
jgi:sulfopyruvate decarboxylase TPP-binding subunit